MRSDTGLQPERTVLAWRRTSVALVGNGILVILKNPLLQGGNPGQLAMAALALVAAMIFYLVARSRARKLCGRVALPRVTPATEMAVAGSAMVALTGCVVAYLLLPLI